jgi:phage tail sheath protein FI
MPDYIAPGVFVEETRFRSKTIEGLGTSTTAFVGPTRFGPVGLPPALVTSYAEFERCYGGSADLGFAPATNYIAHGVRAFFAEGGKRLYVARTAGKSKAAASAPLVPGKTSRFVARFPGAAGNVTVKVQLTPLPAVVATAATAVEGSLLRIKSTPPVLLVKQSGRWRTATGAARTFTAADAAAGLEFITLQVTAPDGAGNSLIYPDLGLDARHPRYLGTILGKSPATPAGQATPPLAFTAARSVRAFDLLPAFAPDAASPVKSIPLTGGTDAAPSLADYGKAFDLLGDLRDVSIVAAPGHTAFPAALTTGIAQQLVAHAAQLRDRIAVLDSPAGQDLAAVQAYRGRFDSSYAALYYPWVVTANPAFNATPPGSPAELTLPPSAFICGIYARCDIERGVFKAPANEVVRSALRFERPVTAAEQEILNSLGINCLRFFTGRGNRVWGARTASSDPEWKYVNVRRYFIYLENSLDRGTQWAVFETNNEPLWVNVRTDIQNFLEAEWRNGALQGLKPGEAFFVKCDRTTMTQNDVNQGRLICVVGVAPIKPAEFIIFRISQQTAETQN